MLKNIMEKYSHFYFFLSSIFILHLLDYHYCYYTEKTMRSYFLFPLYFTIFYIDYFTRILRFTYAHCIYDIFIDDIM